MKRVAILCGGQTAEHQVSLLSSRSILDGFKKLGYEVLLIAIEKSGLWTLRDSASYLDNANDPNTIKLSASSASLALCPGNSQGVFYNLNTKQFLPSVDVVFPILHGTLGEDGTVQGLLRVLNLPFIGADVLGSAVAMDKDVAKRLLAQAGIQSAAFMTLHKHDNLKPDYQQAAAKLNSKILFVKPANAGSSVGVSRVTSQGEFEQALDCAFKYDQKILVEQAIVGREIEISILGNEDPQASLVGEVIPKGHLFYSYESKYLDPDGSTRLVPTELEPATLKAVQSIAKQTYRCLSCEGFARVDFFLTEKNEIFVNEVNTIPGFTSISMYPQLWLVSGVEFSQLLERLVDLALQRHQRHLHTSFERD